MAHKLYSPNLYIEKFTVGDNLDLKTITYYTGNGEQPTETINIEGMEQAGSASDDEKVAELTLLLNQEKAKVENLTNELNAKDENISTLNTAIATKQATINDLNSVIEADRDQIAELNTSITEKDAQISNLGADILAKQEEIRGLEQDVADAEAIIANDQIEISNYRQNETVYATEIAALENEVTEKETIIEEKTALIETKNSEISTLQVQVSALEAEKQVLVDEKAELEADIATKETQIASLESDITDLTDQVDSLNSTITTLNTKIAELEAKNAELEEQISAMPGVSTDPAFPEAISQNFTLTYGETAEFQIYRDTFRSDLSGAYKYLGQVHFMYKNLSDSPTRIIGYNHYGSEGGVGHPNNATYKYLYTVEPGDTIGGTISSGDLEYQNHSDLQFYFQIWDPTFENLLKIFKINNDYLDKIIFRTVWPQ